MPHGVLYWSNWDEGFPLLDALVILRRGLGKQDIENSLWSLVCKPFKDYFNAEYQHKLPVVIQESDFDGLCGSILNENTITIGDYIIEPIGSGELTNAYGEERYGTVWGIFNLDFTLVEKKQDCDEWEMANQLYSMVNGSAPNSDCFGENAEQLDLCTWSIYDPQYVPLLKRAEAELEHF
ncbi:hypothetical protein OH460_08005 [Vibrio sp. Makdt]|uniref:hypothetical protein n=1 Tax=Vibrio sp. Makdt TaxID=2998828 RepID=UPI0022CDAC9E|nr:hypothetical protein [Vibrio sp. Makdt]MDA0152241.1 hypothetical protein [Vibrio sp. Makdt]